jgi:hypothetical protein
VLSFRISYQCSATIDHLTGNLFRIFAIVSNTSSGTSSSVISISRPPLDIYHKSNPFSVPDPYVGRLQHYRSETAVPAQCRFSPSHGNFMFSHPGQGALAIQLIKLLLHHDFPDLALRLFRCLQPHRELLVSFSYFTSRYFLLIMSRKDSTPDRGSQLPCATALIISSLGLLDPDAVHGRTLDMDQ